MNHLTTSRILLDGVVNDTFQTFQQPDFLFLFFFPVQQTTSEIGHRVM